jgi:hypothetical protein
MTDCVAEQESFSLGSESPTVVPPGQSRRLGSCQQNNICWIKQCLQADALQFNATGTEVLGAKTTVLDYYMWYASIAPVICPVVALPHVKF